MLFIVLLLSVLFALKRIWLWIHSRSMGSMGCGYAGTLENLGSNILFCGSYVGNHSPNFCRSFLSWVLYICWILGLGSAPQKWGCCNKGNSLFGMDSDYRDLPFFFLKVFPAYTALHFWHLIPRLWFPRQIGRGSPQSRQCFLTWPSPSRCRGSMVPSVVFMGTQKVSAIFLFPHLLNDKTANVPLFKRIYFGSSVFAVLVGESHHIRFVADWPFASA